MRCDTTVRLGRLGKLSTPIILSSGTFGVSDSYLQLLPMENLGAVVTKTITREPKSGNPQPRIYEGNSFMINSVGLENPGVDAFVSDFDEKYGSIEVPIIVSISGNSVTEFKNLAERLNVLSGIFAIELNLSCPNVDSEGLAFGSVPSRIAAVINECKQVSRYPLIAKLSPFQAINCEFAVAAEMAGADALSLINTIPAMKIDVNRFRSFLGANSGGMSGPAIKPIALKMVYEISSSVDIPVIGMGGISTGEDAVEFLMAGANAVAIGTMNLVEPALPTTVLDYLKKFMEKHAIKHIEELSERFRV